MTSRIQLALAAMLVLAVLAPSAAGSPVADLTAIIRDYSRDDKIKPCRFTQSQLKGARKQIGDDVQSYAPGLREAITREIKRWKSRRCRGKRGYAKLRIVSVRSKGAAGKESVLIQNRSRRTVSLHDYALRDAGDHMLKLRRTKLKGKGKLRIVTGCRKGHRKAVRRGSRYYVCRSSEVWDDAGDVVELLGPGGGLISRKTYK